MAGKNTKVTAPAPTGSINDLKEGDFLDPNLGLDPESGNGSAGGDGAAGSDETVGGDGAIADDETAGDDGAAGDDETAGGDNDADDKKEDEPVKPDANYIVVVVTGATLTHNGKEYPHSRTVKLPRKTAERLTAIGLVKPLSVLQKELAAQASVGLTISTDAGGVEIITGG